MSFKGNFCVFKDNVLNFINNEHNQSKYVMNEPRINNTERIINSIILYKVFHVYSLERLWDWKEC